MTQIKIILFLAIYISVVYTLSSVTGYPEILTAALPWQDQQQGSSVLSTVQAAWTVGTTSLQFVLYETSQQTEQELFR